MADIAWNDREDVTVPLDAFWHKFSCGTEVQTEDGRKWTMVYRGLDGFGVIEGRGLGYGPGTPNEALPPPTHMLRQPYPGATLPCIGDRVIILHRPTPIERAL